MNELRNESLKQRNREISVLYWFAIQSNPNDTSYVMLLLIFCLYHNCISLN